MYAFGYHLKLCMRYQHLKQFPQLLSNVKITIITFQRLKVFTKSVIKKGKYFLQITLGYNFLNEAVDDILLVDK